MGVVVCGLMNCIWRNIVLDSILGMIGCIIFSIYIIYDIQVLMIGEKSETYSPDDYIYAALGLYN